MTDNKTPYERMTDQEKIELMANSSLSHFQNLPAIEQAVNAIMHDMYDRGFFDGIGRHVSDEMGMVYREILSKVFDSGD